MVIRVLKIVALVATVISAGIAVVSYFDHDSQRIAQNSRETPNGGLPTTRTDDRSSSQSLAAPAIGSGVRIDQRSNGNNSPNVIGGNVNIQSK